MQAAAGLVCYVQCLGLAVAESLWNPHKRKHQMICGLAEVGPLCSHKLRHQPCAVLTDHSTHIVISHTVTRWRCESHEQLRFSVVPA